MNVKEILVEDWQIKCSKTGLKEASYERFFRSWLITAVRVAKAGKTAKTEILPGFCGIESNSTPVIWPPLWRFWLSKIYHGGPGSSTKFE